jgi:hypothetical protein
MAQWVLEIPEQTDQLVRKQLGDVSDQALAAYVNDLVRRQAFDLIVQRIRAGFSELSSDQVERLVDEAVDWARATRS